ncbi:MAG: TolC family protein [Planctomycetes bacterium]|nr:TolC family protein [Planctomycetota bacterium]
MSAGGSAPRRRGILSGGRRREGRAGLLAALPAAALLPGCLTPLGARLEADEASYGIIERAQQGALGRTEPFTIEAPADTLRRRLLLDQDLPRVGPASLGSKDVEPIPEWPDPSYLGSRPAAEPDRSRAGSLEVGLLGALEIGARNSRAYQTEKERVFQAALALDLEDDHFRKTWAGVLSSGVEWDALTDPSTTILPSTAQASGFQRLKNGTLITLNLAVDLVKLLTQTRKSSFGILGDASVAIPLLRGSGSFVVAEPLHQAERDVVYAIYNFERFKRVFAVQVAADYYGVLQLQREAENQEENYRWLIGATRRARRMSEAQRLERIEEDQTRQDELEARDAWVESLTAYERALDRFKQLLGLPADAGIALRRADLDEILAAAPVPEEVPVEHVPADAPVLVVPPGREGGGPFELEPGKAVRIALENRLDLRVSVGRVFDSQRQTAVTADRLRADLVLFGGASIGERRLSAGDALLDDANFRPDEGRYSVLASLDLPLERTAERNLYRTSLIAYERSVRAVQEIEDQVKFEVRDDLRVLREARDRMRIQAQSVRLAEQRVEGASRLFEVNRAEARDVLEAQSDLVEARNRLSLEVVRHRVAELSLQRDLEVLGVDETGRWTEVDPGALQAGGK